MRVNQGDQGGKGVTPAKDDRDFEMERNRHIEQGNLKDLVPEERGGVKHG